MAPHQGFQDLNLRKIFSEGVRFQNGPVAGSFGLKIKIYLKIFFLRCLKFSVFFQMKIPGSKMAQAGAHGFEP